MNNSYKYTKLLRILRIWYWVSMSPKLKKIRKPSDRLVRSDRVQRLTLATLKSNT